jgi:hypothetical protein
MDMYEILKHLAAAHVSSVGSPVQMALSGASERMQSK